MPALPYPHFRINLALVEHEREYILRTPNQMYWADWELFGTTGVSIRKHLSATRRFIREL